MEMKGEQSSRTPSVGFSRRGFLQASTTLAAAGAQIPALAQSGSGQVVAYVGTSAGNGKGIHIFNMNTTDGTLTQTKLMTGIPAPSSLALHPNNKVPIRRERDLELWRPQYNGLNHGNVCG